MFFGILFGDTALSQKINNAFYDLLGEEWYTAQDHPIALLRAENAVRTPWVIENIHAHFRRPIKVIDLGCGAGFLANALAKEGHEVTGVDLSSQSLSIATKYDVTQKVHYLTADAIDLPFKSGSFDAVCAMDLLEHVETPQKVIEQAKKMLRPNGLFFFHTFNRNFISYLVAVKGLEWFVRNSPKNIHLYPLLIKPKELKRMCESEGFSIEIMKGFVPKFFHNAFWKLIFLRKVSSDFRFVFTKSLLTGYCGIAKKQNIL